MDSSDDDYHDSSHPPSHTNQGPALNVDANGDAFNSQSAPVPIIDSSDEDDEVRWDVVP